MQQYTNSFIIFLTCVKYLRIHYPTENKQSCNISVIQFELNQFILPGYAMWKCPKEKHAFN